MKKFLFPLLLLSLLCLLGCAPKEPQVVTTIEEDLTAEPMPIFVTHYALSDGTWKTDDHTYAHRLELTGRLHNAAADTTYVYLSNVDITFDRAWKASGLSSNLNDYFPPEEAVLVAMGVHRDQKTKE